MAEQRHVAAVLLLHVASCVCHPFVVVACVLQDVQRNMEPKNRDRFTQNLTIVRHDFRTKV